MVEENNPLVTVIVPSYNHEKYINQTIESILNQTYKNIEFIVVDDGSKDNSPKILKELSEKYNFILILQENKGLARTLTDTIKKYANGKYISLCASDDYWINNKIELQVEFMENNPKFAMCYGKSIVINGIGETNFQQTESINFKLKGGNIFREILLIIFHPPVNYMIKKSIIEEFGYYKDGIWAEDFYMNCKISEKYEIGFVNEFLSYYRVGYDLGKINTKAAYCHLKTINEFKHSQYFKEALIEWNYRFFCWFSPFYKHKKESIKAAIYCCQYIYKQSYIKALLKLIILWK